MVDPLEGVKSLEVNASQYAVDFFKEMGFIRKKCKYCGSYFWTLSENQEHCNDAPCIEYYFWDIPKKQRNLSVSAARRLFIEFFRSKGHAYIEPRPVVARWREDLYLTIASIVVFQPHVTRGIVPPPANPLVIVQPSIRLEDIDNVGITFGRHLTSFEMGGHHAFNYPNNYIYWKNETVRYAFEFFTKILGIPPEAITFKESWWEGGGNAGPCFEVTVGGLELATLVFMQYDVTDEGYRELPLKIVDTGYGIERIAWFTQNTPTAFHAIYGPIVDRFFDELGVDEIEENILWEGVKLAGRMDPDNPQSLQNFYKTLSARIGLSEKKVREELSKAAMVYALLDHTKTIALMLGDGIVPSNTGEGYLARLVIRRAYRLIHKLNAKIGLVPLIELQINFWSSDYYPQLNAKKDYIIHVVELEERKYKNLLESSTKIVERIIRKRKKLDTDSLIELYDSHGVPPDIVKDIALKYGIKISIPHDFYARVARKHGASSTIARKVEKPRLPPEIEEWARAFPETRRLFHEKPYERTFKAKVLGFKKNYLILDKTLFYPTGGGQQSDKGVIKSCGESYKVTSVEKTSNNVVVHVLDRIFNGNCNEVEGEIDWQRRYKLMRHHTAVHILLGAARRVLGDHVWQAGAEKTPEKARLDITHYELPSLEEVRRIEELANNVILEKIPVETTMIDRNEAEARYGFKIYQGGIPLDPVLRIVRIGGWDVEACFGTHVANTSEIGCVKVVNVDKIQDGVIRFEIVAGTELARYASSLENKISAIASTLSASPSEIDVRLKKLLEEYNSLRRKYSNLKTRLLKTIVDEAIGKPEPLGRLRLYKLPSIIDDEDFYREAMKEITSRDPYSLVIAVYKKNGRLILEASTSKKPILNLLDLAKKARRELGLKGGGKEDHIILMINSEKDVDRIIELVKKSF